MSHEADDLPSTSLGNTGGLNFIKRNGGLVLLRAGYQYTKKRQNKNGWNQWRCVKIKECSGSLQLKDGIISNEKNHSCKPDEVNNLMLTKLNDLREIVINADFTPIPRIYNKFKSQLYVNSEMNLVEKIPSFKNIKSKLCEARNREAGISKIKCKTVDEVEIPKQFQSFVFHDHNREKGTTRKTMCRGNCDK